MPDSRRPLPPMRAGAFDDPPASSEASTPQTRRQRLRRAILGTNALAHDVINMAPSDRQGRRSTVGGLTRRRQRSSSAHDELSTSTPEGEDRARRRSTKRRRLNAGVEAPLQEAIKYGYYGQVESGRLKLELVSCDGGQHVDHRHPETSLGPDNLLRHDKSVYCSELPQSNIILKHADDTPFCLEKLHIVGPEIGFTAPVRAGVVHVAMTMADLQKYVQPRHDNPRQAEQSGLPPHARRSRYSLYRRQQQQQQQRREALFSRRSPSPELLTVAEALRDPYVNGAYPSDTLDLDDSEAEAEADAYCDSNLATDPANYWHFHAHRTQPATILSDEDAGPEESSPQEVLDFRSQRERLMRRRYDIENWHRARGAGAGPAGEDLRAEALDSYLGTRVERRPEETLALSRLLARNQNQNQERGPRSGREEETDEDGSDGSLPPLEPITPPEQEREREREREQVQERALPPLSNVGHYCPPLPPTHPLSFNPTHPSSSNTASHSNPSDRKDDGVTTAKFSLSRGKYKVAIKFDPPVSGRFILLKLWGGESDVRGEGVSVEERQGDGNVDVQAVVAKGWMGGMRFFPSVERK